MLANRPAHTPLSALLVYAALFLSGCGGFIFNPQKEFTTDPAIIAATASHEDVFFASADGVTLHGWLFWAAGSKGIVVFLHGYEENISTQARSVLWLVDAGYDVFAPDYRGHGRSTGSPTLSGVNADGLAAIDKAFKLRPEVCHSDERLCAEKSQDRVFVYGQSMGGAIAVWSVANSPHKDKIAALVLDAPFSSYKEIASESVSRSSIRWPLKYLTFLLDDSFSPILWMPAITPVPLLIVHGTQDATNLPYHSQRLYEAAAEPKELWMIEGKGHPDALTERPTQQRLIEYMKERGRRE